MPSTLCRFSLAETVRQSAESWFLDLSVGNILGQVGLAIIVFFWDKATAKLQGGGRGAPVAENRTVSFVHCLSEAVRQWLSVFSQKFLICYNILIYFNLSGLCVYICACVYIYLWGESFPTLCLETLSYLILQNFYCFPLIFKYLIYLSIHFMYAVR